MSLQDEIRDLISAGHLPSRWKIKDLLSDAVLTELYEESYLKTQPYNRSTEMPGTGLGIGNHVINGSTAWFWRINPIDGEMIFCLPEHRPNAEEADTQTAFDESSDRGPQDTHTPSPADSANGRKASKRKRADVSRDPKQAIAGQFVDYLRNKPYRLFESTAYGQIWRPGPITGWLERLNEYSWNGNDWEETKTIVDGFVADLANLQTNRYTAAATVNAERIYNSIRDWGNPGGRDQKGTRILALLAPLWAGKLMLEVDSTLTKMYAFACPADYVIYDSRVATAIMSIAEDLYRYRTIGGRYQNTISQFRNEFPSLGSYTGRGGIRRRGYRSMWPNAYKNVDAQLQANDLCKRITAELNRVAERGQTDWTLRKVEAVLFMEGY